MATSGYRLSVGAATCGGEFPAALNIPRDARGVPGAAPYNVATVLTPRIFAVCGDRGVAGIAEPTA